MAFPDVVTREEWLQARWDAVGPGRRHGADPAFTG
jgi:hypothetical protein